MDYLIVMLWIIGFLIVLYVIDKFVIRRWKHLDGDDLLLSLKKSSEIELPNPSGDKGITMFVDNESAIQAILSINVLKFLNCQLPIVVAYLNNYLNVEYIEYLQKSGVKCIDLVTRCNIPIPVLRNSGRAFALIFSPFKQVILVEPRVIFLFNPEYLFQSGEYTSTGAVFWKDSQIERAQSKSTINWLNGVIPFTKGDNLILNKSGTSYQSGAVAIINKTVQGVMLKKLWILAENIETIDHYIDGEKELYWLACELAKTNYTFINYTPGVIGEPFKDEICGELLFYDSQGNPLFFTNLVDTSNSIKIFTHYAHGSTWKKSLLVRKLCLSGVQSYQLDPNTVNLINEYKKILHDIRNNF